MVEVIRETYPDFYKHLRTKFNFVIFSQQPRFPDNFIFIYGFHTKNSSRFCKNKQPDHIHCIVESGWALRKFLKSSTAPAELFEIKCLFTCFMTLISETTGQKFRGEIFQSLFIARDYNKKYFPDRLIPTFNPIISKTKAITAPVQKKGFPQNINMEPKVHHVETQYSDINSITRERILNILHGQFAGQFLMILDVLTHGCGVVETNTESYSLFMELTKSQ